ncbi:MAG: hypothetical protein MK212_02795 [Saprospiraceae bacterium]|nr:hypothetical protein [Saprospiraceae bacterium]
MRFLILSAVCIFLSSMQWKGETGTTVVIKGKIQSSKEVEKFNVAVLWFVDTPNGDKVIQGSLRTNQSSTKDFKLKVKKPSDDALMDIGGTKLGFGFIIAYRDENNNGKAEDKEVIGAVSDHMMVYLDGDIAKGFEQLGKKEYPLLKQVNQGLTLTKSLKASEHEFDTPFDDLISVDAKGVKLILDLDKVKVPNIT